MKIKVFKISTKEMFTFKNKLEFYYFVKSETNIHVCFNFTINTLMNYLPVENYHRVK